MICIFEFLIPSKGTMTGGGHALGLFTIRLRYLQAAAAPLEAE